MELIRRQIFELLSADLDRGFAMSTLTLHQAFTLFDLFNKALLMVVLVIGLLQLFKLVLKLV